MEKHYQPLAPLSVFIKRLAYHFSLGFILISIALSIGVVGYHYIEQMAWIDAFLNASMILSGMGPATVLQTTAGKLFASFYALFSGLVFIGVIGIIFTPVIHRFLHKYNQRDGSN